MNEKEFLKQIAEVIKKACDIREESYNKEKADEASKSGKLFIDYKIFYKYTIDESVKMALNESNINKSLYSVLWPYISLMLTNAWNDTNDWADQVLSLKIIKN